MQTPGPASFAAAGGVFLAQFGLAAILGPWLRGTALAPPAGPVLEPPLTDLVVGDRLEPGYTGLQLGLFGVLCFLAGIGFSLVLFAFCGGAVGVGAGLVGESARRQLWGGSVPAPVALDRDLALTDGFGGDYTSRRRRPVERGSPASEASW